MASEKVAQLIEEVKNMTVLELSLIHICTARSMGITIE